MDDNTDRKKRRSLLREGTRAGMSDRRMNGSWVVYGLREVTGRGLPVERL